MIIYFKFSCPCGFSAEIKYGRENKDIINEIFSCKYCKNLFNLNFDKNKICPTCKSSALIEYNPHKEENLLYYDKMKNKLNEAKLKELNDYWAKIKDNECPSCKKSTLIWKENG